MKLSHVCEALRDAGIEAPREEALLLLSFFFGKSRASLLAEPDADYESEALYAALDRRVSREPLQYIIGEWPFFEESYEVNEHCLIPRSDTEVLVELAIKLLPQGARFLDLCTGSGCVAVSTLAHRPDCRAVGVDLFPETLSLAMKNAEKNGVGERFFSVEADVLKPPAEALLEGAPFDAIFSNPPYIRSAVVDSLEPELFFEPRAALDGGADGLAFYRAILAASETLLKKDGLILFEIGFDQADDVEALASVQGFSCRIHNDLKGLPRVVALDRRTLL